MYWGNVIFVMNFYSSSILTTQKAGLLLHALFSVVQETQWLLATFLKVWYKGEHDCTVLKRWLCLSTIQQLVIGVSCSSVSAKYLAITVLSHWLYSGTEDTWILKVHLWLPLRPQFLNWCLYGLLGLGSTSPKPSEMFAENCGYDYSVSRLFLFLAKMVADFPSVAKR